MKIWREGLAHAWIVLFVILFFIPLYLAFIAASHDAATLMKGGAPLLPGSSFFTNMQTVLFEGTSSTGGIPVLEMLLNSFIMASLIAVGKIALALLCSFSMVYFKYSGKKWLFSLIFITMMLPVEVRIVPTFQVVAAFGWLNSYAGLTLPLMASATATFLFKQFFFFFPRDLANAAILDGAGPLRFFWSILLPMSKTPIAAMFVILFVYGWNQYLWPLVITTDAAHTTIVMGMRHLVGVADQIPQWHLIMATALLALIPPVLVVVILQRWFEKGLVH